MEPKLLICFTINHAVVDADLHNPASKRCQCKMNVHERHIANLTVNDDGGGGGGGDVFVCTVQALMKKSQ